jgi:hypothetical protein
MRVFTTLDEVAAASGEQIGTSDWLTIDQDRVNRFADATSTRSRRRPGRSVARSRTAT